MKFRELSNELSMSVRDPAMKLGFWLGHYLHDDFKASPAFGAGDAKISFLGMAVFSRSLETPKLFHLFIT